LRYDSDYNVWRIPGSPLIIRRTPDNNYIIRTRISPLGAPVSAEDITSLVNDYLVYDNPYNTGDFTSLDDFMIRNANNFQLDSSDPYRITGLG
jgi:hypothetical protein